MPELYRVDADWQDWLSEIWDEVDSIASESRLRQAVVRATNDTLTHMRSFLSKGIRATYYVKKADIDAAMKIVKARQRGRNIEGRLSFRYRQSLPLSQFGARQGKTYVSVKILKANRARRIQPGGEKWAESGALPAGVYDAGAIRKGIVDRLLGQRLGKPGEVLNGFIWRFLFSRAIIIDHDIRFSGAYLEDELFLMEYFCLARKLAMVDEPLYYYLQNPASVTRNYLPDYMDTFRRFLAAKEAVVERYGLEGDDPQWRQSTCWAGLLIAIGNEYAPGNPAPLGEKRRRVEGFTRQPGMAEAIRDLEPRGMGRNKQLVAGLVRRRWFGLLSLMYAVKNRR